MGYHFFNKVDYSNLFNGGLKESNYLKANSSEKTDTLSLSVIRFEYLDWKFQMIFANNIKNTTFPCTINERAMEMLYFSSYENEK